MAAWRVCVHFCSSAGQFSASQSGSLELGPSSVRIRLLLDLVSYGDVRVQSNPFILKRQACTDCVSAPVFSWVLLFVRGYFSIYICAL